MNETATADGSSGSGGDTAGFDGLLEGLAKEVQRLIADRHIEESSGENTTNKVVASAASVPSDYDAADASTWEKKVHSDGRIEYTQLESGARVVFYLRDQQAWKDVHDSFQSVHDALLDCADHDYLQLATPMGYTRVVTDAFNQDVDFRKIVGQVNDKGVLSKNGVSELKSELLGANPNWSKAAAIAGTLETWQGRAAEMFRLTYVERLPEILAGQLAVAKALEEGLAIADATFRGSVEDAETLAQTAIDQLEAGVDFNWVDTFNTIANVALIASKAAPFVPGAGTVIGQVAGYVSSGAGFAARVAEKVGGGAKSKIEIDADTAEDLAAAITKRCDAISTKVADVEQATGELLQEMYDLATSTEDGVTVYPNWGKTGDGITLTVRQSYFEPKAPGTEKGYGPGVGTIGGKDGGVSDETLRDQDVMGTTTLDGEDLAADLHGLWLAGNDQLPALAEEYSSISFDAGVAGEGLGSAFTARHSGDGSGALLPKWEQLHSEFLGILNGSSENLILAGKALALTAQAYADMDTEAAAELRDINDGKLPWE